MVSDVPKVCSLLNTIVLQLRTKCGVGIYQSFKKSFRFFLSLLDHDTAAELLLLTSTSQILDICLWISAGVETPTALVGQEGERPLGLDAGLDRQVLLGLMVLLEMWTLANVQTSFQKMGSGSHGREG